MTKGFSGKLLVSYILEKKNTQFTGARFVIAFMLIYLGYMIEECFSWYVWWLTHKVLIAWNSDTSSTYTTVFRKWKREFANATCYWGQVIVLERYLRRWCQVQRLGFKATELCFPQNLAQGHCTLENWHGTGKSPVWKGKPSFKPSFLGSLSIFRGV